MSTRITVTSGSDALLASAKQVQDANRAAQLQRERDARTTATATAEVQATTLQPPVGGNPTTSVDRRTSAQRKGGFGLLFQCTFIDGPGTNWSDGLNVAPFVSRNRNTVAASLTTDPSTTQLITLTVPEYTSDSWYSFNVRSPMSGGELSRAYIPFTGKEDGPVRFRYGYAGLKLPIPTTTPVSVATALSPKFETMHQDSLLLNRFPFHCYAAIDGPSILGFGITDGQQTVTAYNSGPTFSVGDKIRIAPEWSSNTTIRSWIAINLIPNLETDYIITGKSASATTTVYTLDQLIYDGAASGIPSRIYKSYTNWAAVPSDEVVWLAADSVLAADLPAGSWDDVSKTYDYTASSFSTAAKAGTAWTYCDIRRVNIPAQFDTITSSGSGLSVPYPSEKAFDTGSFDTYVVRQGDYRISSNTDRLLVKTPYGPYEYNPDLAPDTGYESRTSPWVVQNSLANYDTELLNVTLRQGVFPSYQFYVVQVPFTALTPLTAPGFGNAFPSGTPTDRNQGPPGTYYQISVQILD